MQPRWAAFDHLMCNQIAVASDKTHGLAACPGCMPWLHAHEHADADQL